MKINAISPDEYINLLEDERKQAMQKLRKVILENLPPGFEEVMSYGMIGYVVPHSLYPSGYHSDPSLPLPFMNIASQKKHIALYHMGIYADKKLSDWFHEEYARHSNSKPDTGKSCVRFKNQREIPYKLIGELASKITPAKWTELYEKVYSKGKKR